MPAIQRQRCGGRTLEAARFGVVLKKEDTCNGVSHCGDGGHCSPELCFRRMMDSQTF